MNPDLLFPFYRYETSDSLSLNDLEHCILNLSWTPNFLLFPSNLLKMLVNGKMKQSLKGIIIGIGKWRLDSNNSPTTVQLNRVTLEKLLNLL